MTCAFPGTPHRPGARTAELPLGTLERQAARVSGFAGKHYRVRETERKRWEIPYPGSSGRKGTEVGGLQGVTFNSEPLALA